MERLTCFSMRAMTNGHVPGNGGDDPKRKPQKDGSYELIGEVDCFQRLLTVRVETHVVDELCSESRRKKENRGTGGDLTMILIT